MSLVNGCLVLVLLFCSKQSLWFLNATTFCCSTESLKKNGGVGAVVRSLPSNPKVPGSIPGSAETGIFGDLLSRIKFTQLSILPRSVK